jgi:hypothetical protein
MIDCQFIYSTDPITRIPSNIPDPQPTSAIVTDTKRIRYRINGAVIDLYIESMSGIIIPSYYKGPGIIRRRAEG